MRSRGKRSWIKLWVTGWLHGSIRWQLEPSERSVWADLLCMAGECGREGAICDNDGRPYPRDFIANQLNIPATLLNQTVAKCKREGRIEERDDVIIIANWHNYQSEYDRVKKYRGKPEPTDHQTQLKAASEASTERAKKKLVK